MDHSMWQLYTRGVFDSVGTRTVGASRLYASIQTNCSSDGLAPRPRESTFSMHWLKKRFPFKEICVRAVCAVHLHSYFLLSLYWWVVRNCKRTNYFCQAKIISRQSQNMTFTPTNRSPRDVMAHLNCFSQTSLTVYLKKIGKVTKCCFVNRDKAYVQNITHNFTVISWLCHSYQGIYKWNGT